MRNAQRLTTLILCVSLFGQPLLAFAQQSPKPGFDPSVLISDDRFADILTFGSAEGIQRFLESKRSPLANTSPEFIARLGEPASPTLKEALGDVGAHLAHKRSAAELIWDASRQSGLNPQVILATLQKEQGLVLGGSNTTPDRLQRALNFSMGFDCPDTAGCGQLFNSFYFQLFGNVDTENNRYLGSARSLMKSYGMPGGRGPTVGGRETRVGEAVNFNNTLGGFQGVAPQQTVVLGNRATAALYRYTPHVFNGNYNFWRFFTDWFKYGNGTLVRVPGDGAIYSIQSGERRRVIGFVARARNLDLSKAITISPTEIADYPASAPYGPPDDTVISAASRIFVFRDGIKHPASSFVLAQRKIDTKNLLTVDPGEASQFDVGSQLTPLDGTILRGTVIEDVYRVESGVLRRFSPFTFRQWGAAKDLKYVPDDELLSYPSKGWVPPKDGTLVKGTSDAVFLMGAGQKSPLSLELFKNRGFRFKDVVKLGDEEVGSFVTGVWPTPKELSYFASAQTKALYVFKDGAKHYIPSFVAKQRRITPDWTFEEPLITVWPNGIAVPPRDGTLVKAESAPEIYVALGGQLRLLTGEIFKLRRYSFRNVVTVPAADVEVLPKAGFAPPPELTYFQTSGSRSLYLYKGGERRLISPFVAKQRRITPDHTFDDGVVAQWALGAPVMPRDYTIVKGDASPAYYEVLGGKLRPLSEYAAAHRYAAKIKTASVLPQAEIDGYAKGAEIAR